MTTPFKATITPMHGYSIEIALSISVPTYCDVRLFSDLFPHGNCTMIYAREVDALISILQAARKLMKEEI